MSVIRMAIQAAHTDSQRSEPGKCPLGIVIEIPFEKGFTILELHIQTCILDSLSRLLICIGIDKSRSTQFSSGIVFIRIVGSLARTEFSSFIGIATSGKKH